MKSIDLAQALFPIYNNWMKSDDNNINLLYKKIARIIDGATIKQYPAHGDYGGPITCAVLKYEDGTEIVINKKELEATGIITVGYHLRG